MRQVTRDDELELQSQEVQEIVGRPPHSLVRWGITVFFLAMVGVLLVSWFIRYPDLLVAQVTLKNTPPPVTVVTRVSGTLVISAADSSMVSAGQVIGYIRSTGNPEEVLQLERDLLNASSELTGSRGSLGELQASFSEHLSAVQSLDRFNKNKAYPKQIEQMERQLTTNEKLRRFLVKQGKLVQEELKLSRERFQTDSILYAQRVIATLDFNQAKSVWLQQQRTARNIESEMLGNEARGNDLSKQVAELEIRMREDSQKLHFSVEQTRKELLSRISKWKETYLLTSPLAGRVGYRGFLEREQFVEANKPLVTIIPLEGKLVARAELPVRASGKVKEGQAVNIRLENFPFEQFGMLHGQVSGISSLPIDGKYLLTIDLPRGLVTTMNRELKFKQQLTGTTQVITEDLRLIERFIYQLRALINSR